MRIIVILSILCALSVCVILPVSAAWSIPNQPSTVGNWNGYWQFEYDPNNPISAAMYCCQWEMIHGHLSKYSNASESSDSSSSSSDSSVETKSYCPACHVDDSFATLEVDPELQELSDELMTTKPWLKEGTSKKSDNNTNNSTNKAIMSFSEPTKI